MSGSSYLEIRKDLPEVMALLQHRYISADFGVESSSGGVRSVDWMCQLVLAYLFYIFTHHTSSQV